LVVSRRSLIACGSFAAIFAALPSRDGLAQIALGTTPDWQKIRKQAAEFVASESPVSSIPFEQPDRALLRAASNKVFADYFVPFPLSARNLPADLDLYEREFLKPDGQQGKFGAVGGYIRERPLSAGVWQSQDWVRINLAVDIIRGERVGLDGFIVDLLRLPPDPGWTKILDLYDTAASVAPAFGLVAEPDSAALRKISPEQLASALAIIGKTPSAFRLADGRLLISPFAPEQYGANWWGELMQLTAAHGTPIALLPTFLRPIQSARSFATLSYGMSYWGLRDFKSQVLPSHTNTDAELRRLSANFMQPIAPQDVRPKTGTFAEAGNTRLFREAWVEAIQNGATYVHLITWNDYSESTEIEPSTGTQFVFYDLTLYFIIWFKLGHAPRILQDAIYYCHRREILDPSAAHPALHLTGATPITNQIEMLAFLTHPAVLEVEIAGRAFRKQGQPGLNAFYVDAAHGKPVFRIVRDNKAVLSLESNWDIEPTDDNLDPLYFGGSSTRQVKQ
jgi:hypothetical protein